MSVTVTREFVRPADAAPTTDQAIDHLVYLDALNVALSPVDADAHEAAVTQMADALQRALPRDAKASRADLEAQAKAALSRDYWADRGPRLMSAPALIDAAAADGDRRLTEAAENRRAVALPPVGLTPAEQAALDKEGPSGLLGPLSGFTAAQLAETRRLNATNSELVAVLTLTDGTPTDELLEAMAHGETPYLQRRAERLLRGRLSALRAEAVSADSQQAKDAARAALQRYESIREGRVPEPVRQAEQRERQAWQRLMQHASAVKARAATWQQGIPHDEGISPEVRAQWQQERQAIRDLFAQAWKGVPR